MCVKCLLTMAGAAVFACIPVGAKAGETPPFLSNGQVYGENTQACDDASNDGGEGDGLYIKTNGIFGTEWAAPSSIFCRSVTRPGAKSTATSPSPPAAMIQEFRGQTCSSFDYYDGIITVTSQNDYTAANAKPYDDKEDPFSIGIINKQFALCKK
ncbi:MAG: hypothetical protein R3D29_10140 [Nitratireductor sp.]